MVNGIRDSFDRACADACQLKGWYGTNASKLYRDELHGYLDQQRNYNKEKTPQNLAAVLQSMFGKTMNASDIWEYELNRP